MQKFKELMQLFWVFFKVGLFTFGGGYAMIPIIEREVVEKKHYLESKDVENIIAIAEMTPGPIAVNMATFVGSRRRGFLGAFFATFGLVLPSLLIIIALAAVFGIVAENRWVTAAFLGIRAGVVALLIGVVIRLVKKADKSLVTLVIFLIAFFLATFIKLDVIYIILAGGIFGIIWQALRKPKEKKDLSGVEPEGDIELKHDELVKEPPIKNEKEDDDVC